MLGFFTGLSGEAAIDAYMEHLDEVEREEEKLWEQAMDDELYKKDPILFIKMFGVKTYKNVIDEKGLKIELVNKSEEEKKEYKQKKEKDEKKAKQSDLNIEVPF